MTTIENKRYFCKTVIKQLLKYPTTIFAMLIVSGTCFTAIFGYMLAPDHSPDANTMILELSAKPPGFTTQVLLLPKQDAEQHGNIFSRLISGRAPTTSIIPITAYQFTKDSIMATHYIDAGLFDTIAYPLQKLLGDCQQQLPLAAKRDYIINHLIAQKTFYLGTDRFGRDIASRLIIGSRVTMFVGTLAVLVSLTMGIFLGAVAGYYGGMVDRSISWIINVIYAIPTLLLVFAISFALGKGFSEVIMAIGLSIWTGVARLVRGQVMIVKELDYVTAARALGFGNFRILFRHILPNITGTIMVAGASNFATAILAEAGLSFLGFGVQPPQPSWGLMIKEHFNFLIAGNPLPAVIPGFAIMLLVYAFNIIGNKLSDNWDVRGGR